MGGENKSNGLVLILIYYINFEVQGILKLNLTL